MPSSVTSVTLRPLEPGDLDAVVAIDASSARRTRRDYFERRLRAARREPTLHAQFAAIDGSGLAGCVLARVLAGEFGRDRPALRLEAFGVREGARGAGIGRSLFQTLTGWAQRHDIAQVRTAATWRDSETLAWLDAFGFELATDEVVDCAVGHGAALVDHEDPVAIDADDTGRVEVDYGRVETNDHERLARDRADVRTMQPSDIDPIARIDRRITGRLRKDYIAARLAESMDDAAIRVSLTACCEGAIVGYLMARADLGDFGRTAPVAVMDTLGVDPDHAHRGIGRALLSQLFANLGALRVERVETVVRHDDLGLLGFLYSAGFAPSQRLPFVHWLTRERDR